MRYAHLVFAFMLCALIAASAYIVVSKNAKKSALASQFASEHRGADLVTEKTEAAWRAYAESVQREMVSGDQPREWALAALINDVDKTTGADMSHKQRDALLERATRKATDDALVQWLAANHQLSFDGSAQAAASVAALTRIEPDNAAAWNFAFRIASDRKDTQAADDALARMALAKRYNDHAGDALRAWLAVYDRHPRAEKLPEESTNPDIDPPFAQAFNYGPQLATPGYLPLVRACKAAGETLMEKRAADCAAAGRLMLNHATSTSARVAGFELLESLGKSVPTDADRQAYRDAQWYDDALSTALHAASAKDGTIQAFKADWRQFDEIEVITHVLRRANVPITAPTDWTPSG